MSEETAPSLKDLFFPDESADALPGALAEGSEVWNELRADLKKEMPKVAWSVVGREINSKLQEVLGIRLDEVLAPAWRRLTSLQEYRDLNLHPPGESSLVSLVDHKIESHHRPHVDVIVRDVELATINLDVDLRLTLRGVLLKVENARIREVHGGSCKASGKLTASVTTKAGTKPLSQIERQATEFDLPRLIDLGEGVEIPDLSQATEVIGP